MKDLIRKEMRERRKAVAVDGRAKAAAVICAKLATRDDVGLIPCPPWVDSPVAVYFASPYEIDLTAYIRQRLRFGHKVVAPRWNGETYDLAVVKGLDKPHLRHGPMGILEPSDAEIVPPQEVFAWVVPGLAFTRDGRRLGYGGGWYDRLLSSAPQGAVKLGVAYSFQIVEDIPVEPHDVPLTFVVDDSVTAGSR